MKKVNIKDFGYNLDNIKDAEQKSFMENILGAMCDVVNKANEGNITKEDMTAQFDAINDKLKGRTTTTFATCSRRRWRPSRRPRRKALLPLMP